MNKGQSHLALKEYEPALIAFLQVPVFYPEPKDAASRRPCSAARQAYFGLEDLPSAPRRRWRN